MLCQGGRERSHLVAELRGLILQRRVLLRQCRRVAVDRPSTAQSLRDLRILVPDARLASVRRRVATQVAGLNPDSEDRALSWIEAVSEFDAPDRQADDATR